MISNILFEYLLDQFPLGLYILDNQGRYIYTNDAYDRLLDLPREKLIMRSVHELMHDGHYDACISDIVFREKQPVSVFLNVFVETPLNACATWCVLFPCSNQPAKFPI